MVHTDKRSDQKSDNGSVLFGKQYYLHVPVSSYIHIRDTYIDIY